MVEIIVEHTRVRIAPGRNACHALRAFKPGSTGRLLVPRLPFDDVSLHSMSSSECCSPSEESVGLPLPNTALTDQGRKAAIARGEKPGDSWIGRLESAWNHASRSDSGNLLPTGGQDVLLWTAAPWTTAPGFVNAHTVSPPLLTHCHAYDGNKKKRRRA